MKTNNLKQFFIQKLSSIMPISEAIGEIDFIIKEHLNINKTKLILSPQILDEYKEEVEKIINKRIEERMPLQYILNKATFFDDVYFVDENVLIPRPETELLVNEIVKYSTNKTKILEIGTGSGCIAISIAKILKNDSITSCDISQGALNVAKLNAQNICPNRKIKFVESDIFENIAEKFDIIVSNPPYIDIEFKKDMQEEVLKFEPHNALFAENSGMLFYEKIIKNARNYLNQNGILAFEVGINQAQKVKELLENSNFSKVIIITDLSSIDRVVLGMYN